MNDWILPESPDELLAIVQSSKQVLPVGMRTKPVLSAGGESRLVSLSRVSGILEYEPSEFTFTALAGTSLSEVQAALAEHRQYLPFDPLLVRCGATLGGTVGAGLSGPGRVRFGGLRDFLLGAKFISGSGRVIQAGGKVVKNAAGFDIPKLLAGSLGRLGVMVELTFKVFPMAPASQTIRYDDVDPQTAMDWIAKLSSGRWEIDAIEYLAGDRMCYVRVAGPESANQAIITEIETVLAATPERMELESAKQFWSGMCELDWASRDQASLLVKVPISLAGFGELSKRVAPWGDTKSVLSCGGSVLWLNPSSPDRLIELNESLLDLDLSGLVLQGETDRYWLGQPKSAVMAAAIKRAMDPTNKFPNYQYAESLAQPSS